MRRIRVAIAGAGIGAAHLDGYLANPDLFEVVTVCDLNAKRAARLADRAGCDRNGSYAEALGRGDVDLLDVCLPPGLHKSAILEGLLAGKHIICEKPLTGSLADLDEIIRAAETSSNLVIPIFQYRFGNGIESLCRLIEAGLAGKPLVATAETHWHRPAKYYSVEWRGKWATELGGAIVGHAIHAHDLLVKVLGPVASVQATVATRVNDIEVEDCAAISLEMANGALVTSSVTLGCAYDESRFRFCFANLTAEGGRGLDPYNPGTSPWTFTAREPARQAAIDALLAATPAHAEGFTRQFELAHDAIVNGRPTPVSLIDARHSLDLITAIYQSSRDGTRVGMPLSSESDGYEGWVPAG
jgi:predicted dehydrogenase